jgi:hypothetical protein
VEGDWRSVLKHEFDAGEGSFLLALRVDLKWDRVAFERLTSAMEACCEAQADASQIERWLAAGFSYVDTFTTSWTTANYRPWQGANRDEVEQGRERLTALPDWFFTGESPYETELPRA